MLPALRRRAASPMTSGRQIWCTSSAASAFMMISGPMPAASPMVIPTMGRDMGVLLTAFLPQRHAAALQRLLGAEGAGLGDDAQRARCVGDADGNARLHFTEQVQAARSHR